MRDRDGVAMDSDGTDTGSTTTGARGVTPGGDADGAATDAPAADGAATDAPAADGAATDTAVADAATDRAADTAAGDVTVRLSTLRRTNHWIGVAGITFLTAGLGVAVRNRPLLLAAVVGVAYLAYANATDAPNPSLSVEREVSDPSPDPGDRVEVTVRVTNEGEGSLPDLRVVEQVPAALTVDDGPARSATALRPGAHMTFSYTVLARRGAYDFDGVTAIVRNASGSQERELDLATPVTTLTCVPPIDRTEAVPLRGLTAPYTGRVSTDSAGEGVEFASLREYEHGDPLSRLDWNRYARDGSLATMEFREERMATVVVLLDLRSAAYVQAGDDGPHAVDRAIDATHRIFNSLLDTGDRVGIAALSPEDVWIPPGSGPTHQSEARLLLATHPALSPTPPTDQVYVRMALRSLDRRLPDDAQVVFCSPVADDPSAYVARSLQARGHPVTVVSPNATRDDTIGRRLAAVARSNRLSTLRSGGVRVVDWGGEESLVEAFERARRRWSG